MKERPILFNSIMVKAILEGRKTQTRRVLKVQPPTSKKKIIPLYTVEPLPAVTEVNFHEVAKNSIPHCSPILSAKCPYGAVGDRLWVREAWSHTSYPFQSFDPETDTPFYRADYLENSFSENGNPDKSVLGMKRKWIPSIHMPRTVSRILLEITEVRVEQLNQISRFDAANEGLDKLPASGRYVISKGDQYFGGASGNPCEVFQWLWEETYGEESWKLNPWVWVVKFRIVPNNGEGK